MADQEKLQELVKIYRNILKKMSKEWNNQLCGMINQSQFYILKTLYFDGPKKISNLAEELHITAGAITGASDKLIAEGLAERKGEQRDRRIVYLEITEKGKQVVESIQQKNNEITKKFFEGLSDEDIEHLLRIFSLITENLNQLEKEQ